MKTKEMSPILLANNKQTFESSKTMLLKSIEKKINQISLKSKNKRTLTRKSARSKTNDAICDEIVT